MWFVHVPSRLFGVLVLPHSPQFYFRANFPTFRALYNFKFILWCSTLSCGLQVNYVALRWTRGISLKGRDTQESRLAVARLERGDLIYI